MPFPQGITRGHHPARCWLVGLLLLIAALTGCREEEASPPAAPEPEATESASAPPVPKNCQDCHAFRLDADHDLGCTTCHGGTEPAADSREAHATVIAEPAHPLHMKATCGRCHAEETESAAGSLHFTVAKEVNSVRRLFGATEDLASLTAIPVNEPPDTVLALADDLLRRRCLRCHPYYDGDPYAETRRGTGCAACHLEYRGGRLASHAFTRLPDDRQCLHCHYANTVGADYYGRYEHDYSWEFRTPYRADGTSSRPYGVEYHQLAPDIHQTAGIACIDCHPGAELMGRRHGDPSPLTCEACHGWQPGEPSPAANLAVEQERLVLITRHDGRRLPVPPLRHPAHRDYAARVTCVACHAQWSFNDQGVHLMRHDIDDYEPWTYLTVQSCFEVEYQLETNLFGDGTDEEGPFMIDKISGAKRPGIWYKGYELRRWERPLLCEDDDGRLTVCRPILDLHLSYVNEDDEVVFDAVAADDPASGVRPYTPHTIGKAGAFFRERLVPAELPGPVSCPPQPKVGIR